MQDLKWLRERSTSIDNDEWHVSVRVQETPRGTVAVSLNVVSNGGQASEAEAVAKLAARLAEVGELLGAKR